MDPMKLVVEVGLFYIPFLFALCFHEFAHGFVAKLRGDNTAEMMGRLTMNPLAHIDWIGTVGLPITSLVLYLETGTIIPLFGWAKPVPVNPRNLRDKKNDMMWVALAGPGSNVLLFVLGLVGLWFMVHVAHVNVNFADPSPMVRILMTFLYLNLLLAFFNMLPLHPLDGGKVLQRFIPYNWNRWLEDHQYHTNMVLILLLITGALSVLFYPMLLILNSSVSFVLAAGGGA